MSQCPNCGAAMSCGCQKRVLANGRVGCSKCAAEPPKTENITTETSNSTE